MKTVWPFLLFREVGAGLLVNLPVYGFYGSVRSRTFCVLRGLGGQVTGIRPSICCFNGSNVCQISVLFEGSNVGPFFWWTILHTPPPPRKNHVTRENKDTTASFRQNLKKYTIDGKNNINFPHIIDINIIIKKQITALKYVPFCIIHFTSGNNYNYFWLINLGLINGRGTRG